MTKAYNTRIDKLERRIEELERRLDQQQAPPPPCYPVGIGCVCPPGAQFGCGNSACPRRASLGQWTVTCGAQP